MSDWEILPRTLRGLVLSYCSDELADHCLHNDEPSVSWLVEHIGARSDCDRYGILISLCMRGYAIAIRIFAPMDDEIIACNYAALRTACNYGHTELAEYFVANFDHTAEIVRTGVPFLEICQFGSLITAQWFAVTFGISRNEGKFAFRIARDRGHIAIAEWFAAKFGLTAEGMMADPHPMFARGLAWPRVTQRTPSGKN